MEKSMMHNPSNPFPEEVISTQPTESYPPMEELPLKPPPPQYVVQSPSQAPDETFAQNQQAPSGEVAENAITAREEALTLKFAIGKLNDYLLWFLMVLEVTLLIEFFLKLIGADPNNLFAGFMNALTVIPLYPFTNIVPSTKLGNGGAAIEWSTLIAMAVYFLVFYALRRFLTILISGPEEPVD
jgi:YGGT family